MLIFTQIKQQVTLALFALQEYEYSVNENQFYAEEVKMPSSFQLLILIPLLVICYQIYAFSSTRKGVDRQSRCQKLGIGYITIGILALSWRESLFAFFGLILIMFGLLLVAKGLDRIDKTVFIDRYNDEK